jgi:hypothetical protein
MIHTEPSVALDARYGDRDTTASTWTDVRDRLAAAELYWLTTVRPEGRPHVTPLIAVWLDDAMHFCTGPEERKARNLAQNRHCVFTTGCNDLHEGFDIVLEGIAERVSDHGALARIANAYESKYGEEWHFDVDDGAFRHEGGTGLVFRVAPATVFGFGKGGYSQTRFRF